MFAAEFEQADPGSRRRSTRAPVAIDARLGRSGRTLCRVIDVSQHGAKLQTYSALTRGSRIVLTLPDVGSVIALVMWADDFLAGCQFARPLSRASVEALAARDCD